MARDSLHYDKMVENALRGVVREALIAVREDGLPGSHHFYLTFRTTHPGVEIAERLHAQYPREMTIVLQHQYWGLEVADDHFVVNLSFSNIPERLKVPYAALVSFVDPSVKFGLQFQMMDAAMPPLATGGQPANPADGKDIPALTLATPFREPASREAPGKDAPAKGDAPTAKEAASADGEKTNPEKVVSLDAFRKK